MISSMIVVKSNLIVIGALVCGALLAAGCQDQSSAQSKSSGANSTSGSESDEPSVRVTAIKPQRKLLERRCDQPGEIAAYEETPIYAKVAGYVQSVNVDIGDKIKEGQTLAVISVPELMDELKQKAALVTQAQSQIAQANAAVDVAQAIVETAEAKVTAAQAAIARAAADVERWKSETSRTNELAERSAVTRKVADETLNQLRVAEGAKQEADAQVKSAQASVREAQAKLSAAKSDVDAATARLAVAQADHERMKALTEYATIKAPYNGSVNRRLIHTGHYVQPATTGRDQPLLVVLRSDTVRVVVSVPENDAGFTKIGDPATIRVQSLENKLFGGAVKRVASALDSTTRTLRAEVELENASGELVPGMYCYVSILVGKRPDALVIPSTAVLMDQGKSFCLTVANGRIARTPIEIGLRTGSELEVISGLTGDELVVPKNPASLKDGQRAEVNQ
jgi:HlyD family secretion protein